MINSWSTSTPHSPWQKHYWKPRISPAGRWCLYTRAGYCSSDSGHIQEASTVAPSLSASLVWRAPPAKDSWPYSTYESFCVRFDYYEFILIYISLIFSLEYIFSFSFSVILYLKRQQILFIIDCTVCRVPNLEKTYKQIISGWMDGGRRPGPLREEGRWSRL